MNKNPENWQCGLFNVHRFNFQWCNRYNVLISVSILFNLCEISFELFSNRSYLSCTFSTAFFHKGIYLTGELVNVINHSNATCDYWKSPCIQRYKLLSCPYMYLLKESCIAQPIFCGLGKANSVKEACIKMLSGSHITIWNLETRMQNETKNFS